MLFRFKNLFLLFFNREYLTSIGTIQKNLLGMNSTVKKLAANLNVVSGKAIKGKAAVGRVIANCAELLEMDKNADEEDKLDDAKRQRYTEIVEGYYGQFVNCIEFEKNMGGEKKNVLYKPIEALLKNKIFHHLVANDKVANYILKEVEYFNSQVSDEKKKLQANIKFVAINRLRNGEQAKVDEIGNKDAQPLRTFLQCKNDDGENSNKDSSDLGSKNGNASSSQNSEKLTELNYALNSLCYGLYVCKSFDLCASFKKYSIDFATLEGERINRHGVITFIADHEKTKWQLHEEWVNLTSEIFELVTKEKKFAEACNGLRNEIEASEKQISKLEDEIKVTTQAIKGAENFEQRVMDHAQRVEQIEQKKNSVVVKLERLVLEIKFLKQYQKGEIDVTKLEEDVKEMQKEMNENELLCSDKRKVCIELLIYCIYCLFYLFIYFLGTES